MPRHPLCPTYAKAARVREREVRKKKSLGAKLWDDEGEDDDVDRRPTIGENNSLGLDSCVCICGNMSESRS